MGTLDEVAAAVQAARGVELRLLHCVSGYPTPPEQANLAAIGTLRGRFGVPVGWSDHSCSERVVQRAVARWCASDVEVHIDLDGDGYEAGEHSWSPPRLGALISIAQRGDCGPRGTRDAAEGRVALGSASAADESTLDGDGVKRPMPVELPDVGWRADPEDGLRPLRPLRASLAEAYSLDPGRAAV
jgi:hypothetical protein